jgi:hypothetical protein
MKDLSRHISLPFPDIIALGKYILRQRERKREEIRIKIIKENNIIYVEDF